MLDSIYAAPLRPDSWKSFAEAFCQRLDAFLVVMAFRLYREGTHQRIYASPHDYSGFLQRYWSRYSEWNLIDLDAMEQGRIYGLEDFLPDGQWQASTLYTEHLQPAGLGGAEMLAIGPRGGFRAYLIWMRSTCKGRLTLEERAWIEELVPHLERGIALFGHLKTSQRANELFTDALDHLSFGALALDSTGRILFSNRVADDLIERTTDLSRGDGKLVFSRAEHARIVEKLASDAANDSLPKPANRVLRLRTRNSAIAALLKPIVPRDVFDTVMRARVMIYLHDLNDPVQPSTALLVELLGLAPAEAALAVRLSEGLTLREAAARLGITETSARSYSKRIFAKLGIGRQADLVRMVLRSVAMLGD